MENEIPLPVCRRICLLFGLETSLRKEITELINGTGPFIGFLARFLLAGQYWIPSSDT